MELGACVCVPNGAPRCAECPLRGVCRAAGSGTWDTLPVKEAKKPRRQEEKTVFFLSCGGQYAVRKRPEKGLLAGLWELPNVEGKLSAQQALALLEQWGLAPRGMEHALLLHPRGRAGRRSHLGGRRAVCAGYRSADGLPHVLGTGAGGVSKSYPYFFIETSPRGACAILRDPV